MARSGSWRANPQRSWRHFDQAFNNVAPDDLCRSLRFRHRDRRNGASRGLKHSATGGVVAPPHAFGVIRIEPGNLCLLPTKRLSVGSSRGLLTLRENVLREIVVSAVIWTRWGRHDDLYRLPRHCPRVS